MSRKAKMIKHSLVCVACGRQFVGRLRTRKYCDHVLCIGQDALEKPTLPRGNGAKKVVSSEDSGALMSAQDVVKFLRQLLDDYGQR